MILSKIKIKCTSSCRRLFSTTPKLLSTKKEGYQSIGSFHSDNPEELIRLPNHEYVVPELPFSTQREIHNTSTTFSSSSAPFANSLHYQKAYPYLHRDEWTFLNHGAFGLALSLGMERADSWRMFLESQPLRYFDRYLLDHLLHSARCMVDFCSSTNDEHDLLRLRESVALLPNVTSGMNAVIGGHARCGDNNKIFYFDVGYGSNKRMCEAYHGKNATVIPFEEEFLTSLQRIESVTRAENDWNEASATVFLRALDATIQKEISNGLLSKDSLHGSLLVLDHVTSNTAIHTPILSIAKYAKEEYGMLIAVDGAHGLFALDLDMCKILNSGDNDDALFHGYVDIYLTNAHKWFSSPRGAAVMFCASRLIRETYLRRPAVVSHGVDDGFLSRFLWDGCRDYAAQLSLPVISQYWKSIDTNNARLEMERNLLEGVRILVSKWHPFVCRDKGEDADITCVLKHSAEAGVTLVPLGMHAPMMALVQLPLGISGGNKGANMNSTDAKRVQDFLYSQKIEVPIKCIRGVLYARVSCHLYNTAREFETLGNAILKYNI
jgi:selenocysteine lyase/cysteine desulfurase